MRQLRDDLVVAGPLLVGGSVVHTDKGIQRKEQRVHVNVDWDVECRLFIAPRGRESTGLGLPALLHFEGPSGDKDDCCKYSDGYADAWRSSLFSCGFYGIILLHTFHVSHIVEETSKVPFKPGMDWGENQINTSANVKTWFEMGTLDLQIEHHLFPQISHVHLPSIAPIVKQTAEEFGIPYRASTTYMQALGLHTKMLRELGRPVRAAA